MVRIAPVRLSFNPKTLWFDAGDLAISEGQPVVVSTARGNEFGHLAERIFDMDYEDTKKLKTPLKPVLRIATEADIQRDQEVVELARAALPVFKRLAGEVLPDMNPVTVEYLFDSDKAIFYFDAEDRVDFRELVKKLSAELKVRVDMKQIGVRDGARLVGGLGHCGQEICCTRLGGQFNPVSIRMAKEQDLSLNPQKISGLCGRLLCCLRYEYDAYKDFHARAPKKNARIETPDGEGKVVDLDVPREVVSIKVGDEKPVKVPLADMTAPEEGVRPNAVDEEAWDKANQPESPVLDGIVHLFGTSQLKGTDKLAEPGKVTHLPKSSRKDGEGAGEQKPSRRRRSRKSAGGEGAKGNAGAKKPSGQASGSQTAQRKQRRRSTTVSSDGTTTVQGKPAAKQGKKGSQGGSKQAAQPGQGERAQASKVGRNSSGLRAAKANGSAKVQGAPEGEGAAPQKQGQQHRRRRRRSPKTAGEAQSGNTGNGTSTEAKE